MKKIKRNDNSGYGEKLEPLQDERRHLIQENNLLHLDLIQQSDQRDQQAKQTTLTIKKLENEINDLKFIHQQAIQKIQSEQNLFDNEKKKWAALLMSKEEETKLKGNLKIKY